MDFNFSRKDKKSFDFSKKGNQEKVINEETGKTADASGSDVLKNEAGAETNRLAGTMSFDFSKAGPAPKMEKSRADVKGNEASDKNTLVSGAEENPPEYVPIPEDKKITTKNALKIIYYLMAVDGEIFHSEEEKYDSIGKELDPGFDENRNQILEECREQLDRMIDPDDYYDVLQEGVEKALLDSDAEAQVEGVTFVTSRLLLWNLLTIAYSDESYDDAERKMLKYIVRKTDLDKAVFLEMESSILTIMDIDKEIAWIKTTNRPYVAIETMVNELVNRKKVIMDSIKTLIALKGVN